MAETLSVNGVPLESVISCVLDYGAILSGAPLRGDDIVIPGRDGRLSASRRWFDQASIVLPMVIKGVDPNTGTIPIGSTGLNELRKRTDFMAQLFSADNQPFTLVHTFDDGTQRVASARLAAQPLSFTREGPGNPVFGQFNVALTIPSGSWSDANTTTQTLSGVNGATLSYTAFSAMSARINDAVVTFGPGQDVRIVQGPVSFRYSSSIAAGRKLVVNCDTWDVTGTIDAGGAWAPFTANISHTGDPRFFVLAPDASPGAAPQVMVQHNSATVPVSVTIAAKLRYRTG